MKIRYDAIAGWLEPHVHPKYIDPNQTLTFSRSKLGRRFFVIGLIGLGAGAFLIAFGDKRDIKFAGYAAAILGFALCMYEMHRFFHPGKPLLSLAPDGIRFQIDMVKEIFVPWHEVKALRQIDVTDASGVTRWPMRAKFRQVPALVVTNAFYDRAIHIDSMIMRGPGWSNIFIPDKRNGVMQFALHPEILPVTAEELHAAVDVRWKTFRDLKPRPSPKTTPPVMLPDP